MSRYGDAKENYEKANELMKYVSHSLENAEFDYRIGNFTIRHINKLMQLII